MMKGSWVKFNLRCRISRLHVFLNTLFFCFSFILNKRKKMNQEQRPIRPQMTPPGGVRPVIASGGKLAAALFPV
jgi:hypothetical protein